MVKSSTELIASAKEELNRILQRSIENGLQPSFLEMYYAGYGDGLADRDQGLTLNNDWHYIELEGLPPTDDRCLCLIQADKYQDTEIGWYDQEKGKWHCNYWNESYDKVIAWHMLPTIPDTPIVKKSTPLDYSEICKLNNGVRIANILQDGCWDERYTRTRKDCHGNDCYSVMTVDDLIRINEIEFKKHRWAGKLTWEVLKEYINKIKNKE